MTALPASAPMAVVLRPQTHRAAAQIYDVSLALAGSLLLAASAYASLRLPISPVPITAQTLVVLLIGALFGARLGLATVLVYIAEGMVGLPVFAGGAAGAAYLLGPTGGYLLGFVVAVYVVGRLADRGWDKRPVTAMLAMLIGTTCLYVPGLVVLAFFVGPRHVLSAGLLPFLPGAVVKIALATALLPLGWRALEACAPVTPPRP